MISTSAEDDRNTARVLILNSILEKCRERYDIGEGKALFEGIDICFRHGLAVPAWIKEAFRKGYEKLRSGEARSYDKAFPSPYPKGKHAAYRAILDKKKPQVFDLVLMRIQNGESITNEMFEAVGKEVGLGRTSCSKLYYSARDEAKEFIQAIFNNPTNSKI